MSEDRHPTRTYFRKALRGDRLAVLGLIVGILTVPFVWWVGLVIITVAIMWSRWSYVDWRDVHVTEDRGFVRFLWDAFWDTHQYAAVPKALEPDPVQVETAEPSEPLSPVFNPVVFDSIAYPGVFELETNYLKSLKPSRTDNYWVPVVYTFENYQGEGLPLVDDFTDVRAELSFRPIGMQTLEMARIHTACWVDEPLPLTSFPVGVQRHLVLGAWRAEGSKALRNEFHLFEFNTSLNRAEIASRSIATPQDLAVHVRLIPTSQPQSAVSFQIAVRLFDVTLPVIHLPRKQRRAAGMKGNPKKTWSPGQIVGPIRPSSF